MKKKIFPCLVPPAALPNSVHKKMKEFFRSFVHWPAAGLLAGVFCYADGILPGTAGNPEKKNEKRKRARPKSEEEEEEEEEERFGSSSCAPQ